MTTRRTPTLRELLTVPEYRQYFNSAYKLPANLLGNGRTPWRVWVMRTKVNSISWGTKTFGSYREAHALVRTALKRPEVHDVTVVCQPKGIDPTTLVETRLRAAELFEGTTGLRWCGRCRRPVRFGYFPKHHAYRVIFNGYGSLTAGESRRCPLCGVREVQL